MKVTMLVVAVLVMGGAVLAQKDPVTIEPLPQIRECTTEEATGLNEQIQAAANNIVVDIKFADTLPDLIEDLARDQRSFSYGIPLWPDCADTYQRGYPMMVVMDEVLIAIELTDRASRLRGNDQEDMQRDAQKHLREGLRLLERKLPELTELIDTLNGDS